MLCLPFAMNSPTHHDDKSRNAPLRTSKTRARWPGSGANLLRFVPVEPESGETQVWCARTTSAIDEMLSGAGPMTNGIYQKNGHAQTCT